MAIALGAMAAAFALIAVMAFKALGAMAAASPSMAFVAFTLKEGQPC